MKKRLWLLLILLLAIGTTLAACGEDAGTNADTEEGAEEGAEEGSENGLENGENGTDENADDGSVAGDQTLIFARGGDSESLDYSSTTDGESSRITVQIFESLVQFEEDSFEIKEGLAHHWDVSDDGLSYVFHLREGVTFHDGTDFNAEAVKFNFERWSDPDHPHAYADEGFVYSVYGQQFGGFKGDEGHIIKEINVLGDHEIEFVLNEPLGTFLQNMAMSYFAIASPASFEEHGPNVTENPVGTGPFKFVSWSRDDSIVLEKNEEYWMDGYPKLDRVIFQVIPDNSARLTALRSGEIDIMDGLNPDDIQTVEDDPQLVLHERATNNIGYLGFNTQKEPFDDPVVRRAINHAINKDALIEAMYAGYAQPANNPVPPDYLGYNDSIEPYEYDPEQAQELLAEAGYADGFSFELWTMPVARPYMPDPERAAELLQSDFAQIGLDAEIVTMEWATYLDRTQEGDQDIFMLGWSGVNGDSNYFLNNLLSEKAIPGGNRTFYVNTEVTEVLDNAHKMLDEEERAAAYVKAQEMIHEDAPMVPLVHSIPVLAANDLVQNYVPHPSTSEPLTFVEMN